MIRAPSEMRCRSMPEKLIAMNTMASTSGIEIATTAPARTPRLIRLTASTMAMASHRASMNSSTACSTVTGWSATSVGSMPTGRSAVISRHGLRDVVPERQDVAALAHGDGEPDGVLAVDAEHRLRRVGGAARHARDVAQADDAAVATKLMARSPARTGTRPRRGRGSSRPGLHHARRRDGVLGLQRGDQRGRGRCRGRPAARSRTRRRRARPARPMMSILEMSGSWSSCLRTSSTWSRSSRSGEAVGGEAVDDAVGVAELVVEERADDALRQRSGDVAAPSCAPGTRCPAPRPAASSPSGRRRSWPGRRSCSS